MRIAILLAVAVMLGLTAMVSAQEDDQGQPTDDTSAPPAPSGPVLQTASAAPVICDPNQAGFRYLELRGSGFDAWARQRVAASLVDAAGAPVAQWGSVWVSPQGNLTLEVNLCADPFRNRPALPAGTYTANVGTDGRNIAAMSFDLAAPPDVAGPSDDTNPTLPSIGAVPTSSTGADVVPTFVAQPVTSPPTPTPFPPVTIPVLPGSTPAATPGPRTGLGSQSQPYPLGAPGTLTDGWQMIVTGVTPDAYAGIHDAVPSAVAPAADQKDVEVRVQATYVGSGTAVFSGVRLAMVAASGTVYDQLHNACGILPDAVPPNLLSNGGVVRGNVCFAVRTTDIPSLLVFDNQGLPSDRVFFNTHP